MFRICNITDFFIPLRLFKKNNETKQIINQSQNKMKKTSLLLLAMFLFAMNANAQDDNQKNTGSQTISGVIFCINGIPVDAAVVHLFSTDNELLQSVTSNADGFFSFDTKAEIMPFIIKIRHLNYVDFEQTFSNTNVGAVFLEYDALYLDEVVVQAQRPMVRVRDGILSYDIQQVIEERPVSNVFEALQHLPGVREENESLTLAGAGEVSILINGRASTMPREAVYELLRSMPASSLDRVEVMHSAPPQFHVGTGAAINIITRRGLMDTISGQANAGFSQRTHSNYNAGMSLFYNSDNIYSDFLYSFSRSKTKSGLDLTSIHTLNNQVHTIEQINRGTGESIRHNIRMGLDYNFSEKRSLSTVYTAQIRTRGISSSVSEGNIGSFNSHDRLINPSQMHNINTRFNATDLGLTAGIDFTSFALQRETFYNDEFSLPFSLQSQQNVRRLQSHIDKTHNLRNRWTIGYGARLNFARHHNILHYFGENGLEDLNSESRRDEYIYSSYFRFSRVFSQQFNMSGSLTAEYYQHGAFRDGRFNLLPQLSASFLSADFNHIFQLNVRSERIFPQFFEMGNFIQYINNYALAMGNPYLQPAINYTGTLTYILKRRYTFSFFHTYIDRFFVQLPYQSSESLNLIYQTTNFDFMQRTGMNVALPFRRGRYDTNLNLNGFYHRVKSSNFHDLAFDVSRFSLFASWDNNFTISQRPNLRFHIQGFYMTGMLQGPGVIPTTAWLNSGLRWTFAEDRAELNFRVNDIFNSQPRGMRMRFDTQNLSFDVFPDFRTISLTFAYRFGVKLTPRERKDVDTSRFGM